MKDQLSFQNPVVIKAELLLETEKALYLNCEGDQIWFPRSQVYFDKSESKLTLEEWMYNTKFEEE